jgi:hypothetical protein
MNSFRAPQPRDVARIAGFPWPAGADASPTSAPPIPEHPRHGCAATAAPAALCIMSLFAAACSAILTCIMVRYGDMVSVAAFGALTLMCLALAAIVSRGSR